MKSTLLITALLLVSLSASLAQSIQVFPRQGTLWKYNQTDDVYTATGGTGWTAFSYDDSGPSWKEGPALLSSEWESGGNVNIQPLIGTQIFGPRVIPPVQHTRFFRRKFTYNGPAGPYTILRLNERIDDCAFFWLNGNYIGALRTAGPPDYNWLTRGALLACGGDADCENTVDLVLTNGTELVQGNNVIAVSIHQTGNDSSDITFGFSLDVVPSRAVTIVSNSEPRDRVVVQNRSATLNVYADGSPAPTYQWYFSTTPGGPFAAIQDATNSAYTIASMQQANEGYYYATAGNIINSVTSRTAHVVFTTDTNAPVALGAIGPNFTTVTVQFNEGMDAGTTGDLFGWAVTDDIGGGYEVTAVTLSGDASVARLTLAVPMPENTLMNVSMSGPADLAGNVMTDTNLSFHTYVNGCNTFLFEAFDTPGTNNGNAVSLLTTAPAYPNSPMSVANIASFDSRNAYSDDSHEQYGTRIRGLLIPDTTGPWVFYLASDDGSELWVNPTGPSPAGKQRVAAENGCCNNFLPQGATQTSVPFNLTAGQAYYVESLHKEGGGGDWVKVAARPAGDTVPIGGNSQAGSVSATVIQGGPAPAGILSFVTIGSQPAGQSKIAGQTASFHVGLSPDVPGCYQWKRNGTDIPGAVGPNYSLVTSIGDDGVKFRCAISLAGGTTLLSAEATLGVTIDTTPPTVTSVAQDVIGNITVTFSEPVDMSIATNRNNYSIDGTTPASATASGNNVVLLEPGAPMGACPASHSIVVGNVKDANGVTIGPNPTTVAFTLNNLLVLPINASKLWRYNDSGDELGSAWYATGFNDSSWSNGAPTLAFPGAEVIQAGFPVRTTLAGVRQTTYFRTHFNMPSDPSSVTNLQLDIVLDDGGVLYLNGQELTRIRMPNGPVDTNTLTTAGSPSDPPQILETYNLSPALLVNGDNVLAARVHQSSTTSSDEVFAAGLIAQSTGCTAPRPRLSISRSGNQVTITSTAPGGTIRSSSSLNGPFNIIVGPAPQTVNIGAGSLFFEIR